MAKDPALLWYPGDYVSGTMGMTFEQKGAYMDLLMMQFNLGHLSETMILNHIGPVLWEVIRPKFDLDERGHFFKARIDEEKQKRMGFIKSRNNNKKGINQYSKKRSYDQALTGHMENENINENINEILNDLNTAGNFNYKASSRKTQSLISARIKEGFTVDDFKTVHRKKCAEWLGTDMAKFLRPETLYGTKFESYLNQIETKPKTEADRLAEKHAGILAWAKKAEQEAAAL